MLLMARLRFRWDRGSKRDVFFLFRRRSGKIKYKNIDCVQLLAATAAKRHTQKEVFIDE